MRSAVILVLGGLLASLHGVSRAGRESIVPRPVQTADSMVFPLEDTRGLTLRSTIATTVTYDGRKAVRLVEAPGTEKRSVETVALLGGSDFHNGTIEVFVAGVPGPHADTSDRGFVGIAFRSAGDASRLENIYLRPTNGRATDQLRRNHSVQYESIPEYPWYRLRSETPGHYEAYVDLVAGAWTKMRIVVEGRTARLFVNDAPQPSLVVNDLKLGDATGQLGLWIGPGTEGYFSRLTVTSARAAAR